MHLARLRRIVPLLPRFGVHGEFDLADPDYEARLRDFAPDLIVQYGTETTDPPRDILNRRYRLAPTLAPTIFAENAWLPQSDYLYLDARGLADESAVARLGPDDLAPVDRKGLAATLSAYRARVLSAAPVARERFVLLCLQMPVDTVIERASPFRDMQALIDFVEGNLAGVPLVIRPHPQDERVYRSARAPLVRDGNAAAWIQRAVLLLACNSTTLIEALALGVPAAALGRGIFSGAGVCWSWDGAPSSLPECLAFRPDLERVHAFLWELARRQIPLMQGLPDHTAQNPVLRAVRERWA